KGDALNLDRYGASGAGAEAITQILALLGLGPHSVTLYLDRAIFNSVPATGITLDLRSNQQDGDGIEGALAIADLAGAQVMGQVSLNSAQAGHAHLAAEIPALDRILGAFGVGARRAASFASFGQTSARLDLSLAPERGVGYAFEVLGAGGDARVNGVFTPGLMPKLTVSDGSFNGSLGGYDVTLFDLAGGCDGDGSGGFVCKSASAAMPGLRVTGDIIATRTEDSVDVTVSLQDSMVDLGLFSARAG
ncbi:MAG TPA: hypothetical protein DCL95_12315, partial [Rhodospirillaceae bacterium]|nr:hypothetical protein [Rhodospirillaceae bacterium]